MTQQEMHILVPRKLREIEAQENITILYAVESGSRAWDFASPDSDFDVRFIYVRRPEFYLRLEKTRDVLEYPIDDTWDVSGWDLQKALRLLHDGNPTLFEWAVSPIVYLTTPAWQETILPALAPYFQIKKDALHYLGMAHTDTKAVLRTDQVKLKQMLYTLRALLAAMWVIDRGTPPPIRFGELADAYLDASMRPIVSELLRIKRETPEVGMIPVIPALRAYILRTAHALRAKAAHLPPPQDPGWAPLDALFADMIRRFA